MNCRGCYHRTHTVRCIELVNDGFAGQDPCGCTEGVPEWTLHLAALEPELKASLNEKVELEERLARIKKSIKWYKREIRKWKLEATNSCFEK